MQRNARSTRNTELHSTCRYQKPWQSVSDSKTGLLPAVNPFTTQSVNPDEHISAISDIPNKSFDLILRSQHFHFNHAILPIPDLTGQSEQNCFSLDEIPESDSLDSPFDKYVHSFHKHYLLVISSCNKELQELFFLLPLYIFCSFLTIAEKSPCGLFSAIVTFSSLLFF